MGWMVDGKRYLNGELWWTWSGQRGETKHQSTQGKLLERPPPLGGLQAKSLALMNWVTQFCIICQNELVWVSLKCLYNDIIGACQELLSMLQVLFLGWLCLTNSSHTHKTWVKSHLQPFPQLLQFGQFNLKPFPPWMRIFLFQDWQQEGALLCFLFNMLSFGKDNWKQVMLGQV